MNIFRLARRSAAPRSAANTAALAYVLIALTIQSLATVHAAPKAAKEKEKEKVAPVEAAPMLPGLWETAVYIETAGEDVKRTNRRQVCYDKELIAMPQQLLPQQQEVGMQCTTRDFKLEAGVASWDVLCTSKEGTLTGPGQIKMSPTAYAGSGELTLRRGGKSVKVIHGFGGKRLGDCPR
jgi:hypothetical protein